MKPMWKTLLIIAIITIFIEFGIILSNFYLVGKLNIMCIVFEIGYLLWSVYCFYKYKKS